MKIIQFALFCSNHSNNVCIVPETAVINFCSGNDIRTWYPIIQKFKDIWFILDALDLEFWISDEEGNDVWTWINWNTD